MLDRYRSSALEDRPVGLAFEGVHRRQKGHRGIGIDFELGKILVLLVRDDKGRTAPLGSRGSAERCRWHAIARVSGAHIRIIV